MNAKHLSVALIGPNEPRRWEVSSVLAECRGVRVREFSSYPTALDDAPKLLERYFDVIIVDLDSDQEFALKLVSSICADNTATVIVVSEKNDRELMNRCMRAGAREYLVLPFDHATLGKALVRARIGMQAKNQTAQKATGDLLVFLGAKGGTGVTTIACNLAIALAQEPDQSTLLIDLAVPLGDAALNLGIAAEHSTDDALKDAERLDGRLLTSFLAKHRSGVYVLAAPSKVPEVEASKEAIDKLVAVARQQFDHVIVDVGPRIDLMATDLFKTASTVYLVTQAGISELRNSNRLISQFFSEDGPRLEVVLNRFSPNPQGGVNEDVVTKALGRPVRWKIPDDQGAAHPLQSTATSMSPSDSPVSRLILLMASSVSGQPVYPDPVIEDLGTVTPAPEPEFTQAPPPVQSVEPAKTPAAPPAPPAAAGEPPSITWPAPEPILYGTTLSSTQLNATASAAGTLMYTPGPGYMLPAGTHTLWVTFTPERAAGSAPMQSAVSITVSKATPALSWPAPAEMPSGTPLAAAQLNATASVAGEFLYQPAAGEVLEVGTHTLEVVFTPADSVNFNSAHTSVTVNVAKQTPVLQWNDPEPIHYGTALSSAQLNASASVAGTFAYSPAEGEMLAVGEHTITVTFTPEESANYYGAEASVRIAVTKESPAITWPEPASMVFGETLGEAQLNATSTVPGTFAYTPAAGSLLAAGDHTPTVVFTPDDLANYAISRASVRLTVAKAGTQVEWAHPEAISSAQRLGPAQLNATASVPGTFIYQPAAGELLPPGTHVLSVTFKPSDPQNYTPAQTTVPLTITEPSPTAIIWRPTAAIPYGTPLGETQLSAMASAPGTLIYSPAAGVVLAPGKYALAVEFRPTDAMRHAPARAGVELTVEAPAAVAPAPKDAARDSAAPPSVLIGDGSASEDSAPPVVDSPPPPNTQRETRTYKGAIYEKGDDGQWHLQQK